MAEIIMPKMGDAMTEGKVVRWYKNAGDAVKKGEPLLEIETDKVNLDLEAEEDGVLGDVAVEAGTMADVGATLAVIRAEGEAAAPKEKTEPEKAAKEAEKVAETQTPEKPATPEEVLPGEPEKAERAEKPKDEAAEKKQGAPASESAGSGGRTKSSPLARKMARELGVDIAGVKGSGPSGRVVAADIKGADGKAAGAKDSPSAGQAREASLPAAAKPLERREVPLTAMRRTIAKRLVESLGPIPHFFLTIDVDATELLALRKKVNEVEGVKVSVNDFVVRAAALAILSHPNVNASFGPEAITEHGEVHIGIAVATPEGLITPVIRNADQKSVRAIGDEARDLSERARNRKLLPDQYQGSTFTISNLGMFGIEEFTAIINPPNAAILAVGAAMQKPVVVDDAVVVRDRMKITMSCDHRVIDGAAGAEYLSSLRELLEAPLSILV
jgi:pyruvate dehydrogenase E2 component (dihydrolipoamide acetyltransferase)